MPFGGMLGSTFNFVFETQMEALQNGDRFYYLRAPRRHQLPHRAGEQLVRQAGDGEHRRHAPAGATSSRRPGFILEVDQTQQFNDGLGERRSAPIRSGNRVTSTWSSATTRPPPRRGDELSASTPATEHVVLGGTDGRRHPDRQRGRRHALGRRRQRPPRRRLRQRQHRGRRRRRHHHRHRRRRRAQGRRRQRRHPRRQRREPDHRRRRQRLHHHRRGLLRGLRRARATTSSSAPRPTCRRWAARATTGSRSAPRTARRATTSTRSPKTPITGHDVFIGGGGFDEMHRRGRRRHLRRQRRPRTTSTACPASTGRPTRTTASASPST